MNPFKKPFVILLSKVFKGHQFNATVLLASLINSNLPIFLVISSLKKQTLKVLLLCVDLYLKSVYYSQDCL